MTKKKQSFEENITQTNEIIERLEKGDLPLEEAMAEYKKGFALVHDARTLLTDAEKEFAALLKKMDKLENESE